MNTTLYQLELNQVDVNCGMSYVFKLKSNDYVIIDGGYFTDGEEDRLYSFLKEKSTGDIRIRAWIFTHAHQDHIGCFINFIEKYSSVVTIDELLYNFQPTEHKFALGSWKKKCNDLATVKHFYKVIEKYKDHFNIHTLKTDESFDIDELHFDVLYTQENLYPVKASFNDYSCVFSISISENKILFLGDVQTEGSAYLLENKKEKLASDFVQVAHHGFNGATKQLYDVIKPEVVLFPTPDFEFEKIKEREVNAHILSLPSLKETYVSGFGDCEFEFPYEPFSCKQSKKKFHEVTKD